MRIFVNFDENKTRLIEFVFDSLVLDSAELSFEIYHDDDDVLNFPITMMASINDMGDKTLNAVEKLLP